MTKWKFEMDNLLDKDIIREIQKKHYLDKAPFAKTTIHEMYITKCIEEMMQYSVIIIINTEEKILTIKRNQE